MGVAVTPRLCSRWARLQLEVRASTAVSRGTAEEVHCDLLLFFERTMDHGWFSIDSGWRKWSSIRSSTIQKLFQIVSFSGGRSLNLHRPSAKAQPLWEAAQLAGRS